MHSDDLKAEQLGEGRDDRATAALEADQHSSPDIPSEQAIWQYDGRSERGRVRRYFGHVTYLGGAEGERLQGDLTAAIHDLLVWAAAVRNAAGDPPEQDKDDAA
ncbi:hypothetical protein [Streptomyces sp. NPDC088794]|uniref:hypothetical protein n=1 Tax=Streptomyces sp. NPDC088794 TaxID=3365902 RepID=UPI0038124588